MTFTQLAKNLRKSKKKATKPQLAPFISTKTITIKDKAVVQIMSPRKPNSAKRKFVVVGWFAQTRNNLNRRQLRTKAYVPGEIRAPEFQPAASSDLLIRSGRVKDLPGVKFTIVRGHKKSLKGLNYRRQTRSKYGAPLWYAAEDKSEKHQYRNFNYK